VGAASLGARRGIGGGVCTKTGVDMNGPRCVSSEASERLAEAWFDAPEAALWLATEILSLEVCLRTVVSRAKAALLHRLAEKVQDLHSRFATLLHSTTFLRAHHVQI
jgi:hypothetical protein